MRTTLLSAATLLVLLTWGCTPATTADAGTPDAAVDAGVTNEGDGGHIIPAGTINEWELMLEQDGVVLIRHFGVTVVSTQSLAWGPSFAWAGFNLTVAPGGATFTGTTGSLNISVTGTVTSPDPATMVLTFTFTNPTGLSGISGVMIEVDSALTSPTFASPPPVPTLLAGMTGFNWAVSATETLSVTASPALPEVYFERGNAAKTRFKLLGPDVAVGTTTVALTFKLPAGGKKAPAYFERYGATNTATWAANAIDPNKSPVDLGALNDSPAGKHGFVKAQGEDLVFEDGTPVRFWGTNVAAYALFSTKANIAVHAERLARLGYNLVRLHHHDSDWVNPSVIDKSLAHTQTLNLTAMDLLDTWVNELKKRGIYVWVDMNVGRVFKAGDNIPEFAELANNPMGRGFTHLNPRLRELLKDFQSKYLSHVNPYTGLALKDDPAVMGILITNENDLTHHFGNGFLPDKNRPLHQAMFDTAKAAFCSATGLPLAQTGETWLPGPSKLFLNDLEHTFNRDMTSHLTGLGVKVPIVGTNFWGGQSLYSLPAVAEGPVVDVHSYGGEESLSANPHYAANFIDWIGVASARGKPLTVTEWNTEYPTTDRFVSPLYLASLAAFQGWDAPMLYNYSQGAVGGVPTKPDTWSTYYDPGLQALMPAAALLYRQGHVRPAKTTYCLNLDRQRTYFEAINPGNSAAVRTAMERSAFRVCLPDVPELSWDAASVAGNATLIDDPARDLLEPGLTAVQSDTGELERDWSRGIHVINTARTQAASGWIGGVPLSLRDVRIEATTAKATIAVSSLDDRPLRTSAKLLLSVAARVVAGTAPVAYRSEPVVCTVYVANDAASLVLVPLAADGTELTPIALPKDAQGHRVSLPAAQGTHWYLLRAP